MKILISLISLLISFQVFALDDDSLLPRITLAPTMVSACHMGDYADWDKCTEALQFTILTTTSAFLLREALQVKPDALIYVSEGTISPALQSVVEKIQFEALDQKLEVSFDEVVDAINMIDI